MSVESCEFLLASWIMQRFFYGENEILSTGERRVLPNLSPVKGIVALFCMPTDRVTGMCLCRRT